MNSSSSSTTGLRRTPFPTYLGITGHHRSGVRVTPPNASTLQRSLKKKAEAGGILPIVAGCYIDTRIWRAAPPWDRLRLTCIAAGLKYRNRFLASHSAVAIHRLPTLFVQKSVVLGSLSCKQNGTLRASIDGVSIIARKRKVPASEIVLVDGIATTSLNWTVATALAELAEDEFYYGLMLTEAALRQGASLEKISEFSTTTNGKQRGPWTRQCIRAANLRSDSSAESYLKALLLLAGITKGLQQADIYEEDGEWLARVDFLLTEYGIIIEVDGEVKYSGDYGTPHGVLRREKLRENNLVNLGYRVLRFTWDDLKSGKAIRTILAEINALPAGTLQPRGRVGRSDLAVTHMGERIWHAGDPR